MIMISLIGEQPIPNLLPVRAEKPDVVVLVHSSLTEKAAGRLKRLLSDQCQAVLCPVERPYDIAFVQQELMKLIENMSWDQADLLFNLTGGTKPMSFGAYLAAAGHRADFLYLQTEGKRSLLFRYGFDSEGAPHLTQAEGQLLPALLTLDDYLHAFLDDYPITGPTNVERINPFERAVADALESVVDELKVSVWLAGALEVDLVVRCGNQVGIIEAKTGSGVKKGIDQLNGAAEPRYLGTYTQKMLVSDQTWDHTRSNLRELAAAHRITVIELPSFGATQALSDDDKETLKRQVCQCLGVERAR